MEQARLLASKAVPLTMLACSDCDQARLYRHARRAAAEIAREPKIVVRFKLDEFAFWSDKHMIPGVICSESGEVWHFKPQALSVLQLAETKVIELTQLNREPKLPKGGKARRRWSPPRS